MSLLFRSSPLQRRVSLAFGLFGAACFIGYSAFLLIHFDLIDEIGRAYITTPITPVFISALAFLLSYRRPENPVSWIMVVIAFLIQTVYLEPLVSIIFLRGSEPSLGLLVLRNAWPWLSGLISTILAFVFVVFPTGRLPSPHWRLAYWLLGLQVLVSVGRGMYLAIDLSRAFALARRGLLEIALTPTNRTGPLSTSLHTREMPEQADVSLVIGGIALAMVLLGFAALLSRFRRGSSLERQQVKWLLFALVFWAVSIVLIVGPFNGPIVLFSIVFPLILGAIAVAILRYRLYDIDIIINRALVYSLLTVLLATLYFSSVLALQGLFQQAAGEESPLAVVASTLLIAAAFTPLRRRLQGFIDKRFYRSKYDAAETLAQFAAAARSEVDLDAMSVALMRAVARSMHPREISLWLRER